MDERQNRATGNAPTETLGALAVAMVPVQQVLVFAFLFIQPDRPLSDADSLYALGTLGWLWRVGAIVTGLGVMALAWGLSRSVAKGKRVRLAISTMIGSGLAVVGTGVFPTDSPRPDGTVGYTTGGVLHFVFGILALLALLVTVSLLRGVFRRDPRWFEAARPIFLAGLVAAGGRGPVGLAPRVLDGCRCDPTARLHPSRALGDLGRPAGPRKGPTRHATGDGRRDRRAWQQLTSPAMNGSRSS